jgi:hypothetical protein
MDNDLLYAKIEALEGKRPLAHRKVETMSRTLSPSLAREVPAAWSAGAAKESRMPRMFKRKLPGIFGVSH